MLNIMLMIVYQSVDNPDLFWGFKGELTEQYVLQQLKTIKGIKPYYWTNDRNSAEIEFLVDNGSDIIPLEVKAEINLNAKSLKVFREKFSPAVSVRLSIADYKEEEGLINLPLYAIGTISQL